MTFNFKSLYILNYFSYRLAPENPYPIPIDDCYTATHYIINNLEEFNINIDLSKIIFCGDSAGKLKKKNYFLFE